MTSFRIAAFKHPDDSKSRLYKQCKKPETLMKYFMESLELGCNLWSIRLVQDTSFPSESLEV